MRCSAIALLAVLGLAACGGGGTTDPPPPPPPPPPVTSTPTSIILSQSSLALDDTASVQLQATVMDQTGKAMASPPALQWSSADSMVARVDGTGRVTGRRAGEVEIAASAAGLRGALRATVRAVPTSVSIVAGDAQSAGTGAALADSLAVRVADRHGQGVAGVAVAFQVASGGGSVSRASAPTGADGLAKTAWTLGAGLRNNRVTASAGTLAVSFVATATESSLIPVSGGTIADAAGEVKLVLPAGALAEPTRITVATVETPAADGRVVPGTIHDFGPAGTRFSQPVQLSIAYDPALVPAGTSEASLRLHLWTGDGWERVPGSTVNVASDVVTGPVRHFSRYAVASSDAPADVAVSIQADVSKTAVASASVEVTGAGIEPVQVALTVSGGTAGGTLLVPEGADRRFVVRAHDAHGVETHRGSALVSLSSSNTSLNVTLAALNGSVPIVARIGTYVLTISPATPTLRVGESLQMTAAATDARGAAVGSAAFTWASSNPSVAQVDAGGRVTARYPGTARIVANYQGLAVAASLTVNP